MKECGVLQRKVELLENQLKQLHYENSTLQHSSPDNAVSSVSRPSSCVLTNGDDVKLSDSWNAYSKNLLPAERAKVTISLTSNYPYLLSYMYIEVPISIFTSVLSQRFTDH